MSLNRATALATKALFSVPSLDKNAKWNGHYGVRPQRWIVTTIDTDTSPQYNDPIKRSLTLNLDTYRIGYDNEPGWKERRTRLIDVSTPFAATSIEVKQHKVASYSYELKPGVYPWSTSVAYGIWDPAFYMQDQYMPAFDSTYDAAVRQGAILQFYDKMSDPFSGATFLGELKETVHMFRHPLAQLNKSIDAQIKTSRALRAKTVRDAKRAFSRSYPKLDKAQLKKAADASSYRRLYNEAKLKASRKYVRREWRNAASASYLEWKWGVKPLLSDVESLFESLKLKLDKPHVHRFKYGSEMTTVDTRVLPRVLGGYAVAAETSMDVILKTVVLFTGALYSRIDSNADLSSTLGIGPKHWVPAAYELMPYSWLIDYFTTLGSVINAFVTLQSMRFVYCNETVRHFSEYKVAVTPVLNTRSVYPHQLKWWIDQPGQLVVRKKHVSRNPSVEMPLPYLTWSEPLSTGKVANLTAFGQLKGEGVRFRNRYRL